MALKNRKTSVRCPKQNRSKATVAVIVEAGTRILAEEGWAAFNTNAVAAKAGVSVGSVYEYFNNKQSLIDAITDAHLPAAEKLLGAACDQLSVPIKIDEIVDLLIEGFVTIHEANPPLHRTLSSEVPLSNATKYSVHTLRLGIIDVVSRALAPHLPAPGVAAQLLVDTVDTVTHRWLVEDDGALAAPDRLKTELKRMFSAYLLCLR